MGKKQIIFVIGILTGSSIESRWKSWLERIFPHDEIIMIGGYYTYFDFNTMQKKVTEIEKLIESNKETILIGHSFGGIIINSALNKSKKNNVTRFISIFSPHSYTLFGMNKRKKLLGYSQIENKNITLKSFGAYFDHLVPFFSSKQKNSIHKNYFTDHYIRLSRSEKFFKKVILEGLK